MFIRPINHRLLGQTFFPPNNIHRVCRFIGEVFGKNRFYSRKFSSDTPLP